ncbi:MAG: hypothetical protein ABI947_10785 [Chloroflexota bacterium]
MNRLFQTLRGLLEKPQTTQDSAPESSNSFDNRIEVLSKYAERASGYEDELLMNLERVQETLAQLQERMEESLDEGKDSDALEYLRLAARLRPQRDLLDQEIRAFQAVATDLMTRIDTLMSNLDEARRYAQDVDLSPAATYALDAALNRLTRYFVLLERVAIARHRALPQRLAEQMMVVIDDRQLDLEFARFILSRRHALGPGRRTS